MEIVLHWENRPHNFINQEIGASSKNRLGCKPNNLAQKTVLTVNYGRLDLKFKKKVESALLVHKHYIRKDTRCKVYINNKPYSLSCRNAKKFSNDLTNILIKEGNALKLSMDTIINKN